MLKEKPDIDGYIVSDMVSDDKAVELLQDLVGLPDVKKVAVEKAGEWGAALHIKIPFEGKLWNIDLHFVTETSLQHHDYLGHHTYTPEQLDIMLLIKAQLKEKNLYPGSTKLPGSLSSVDVYRAVSKMAYLR